MRRGGEIHIIEVVAGVLFFLSALSFTANFSSTPRGQESARYQIKELGDDTLRALDTMPNPNYTSNLTAWVIEANESASAKENLTDFINSTLPKSVSYAVYLRNLTWKREIYTMGTPIGDKVVSSRLIVDEDKLYEVELLIWWEPRG